MTKPKITEMFLTPNKFSRPQFKLEKVTKIAVHYVGNPNTSAEANRNYFENQKNGGRYVSSHFIIGLEGEIIQCIPLTEWSYCTNQANGYSISIECCHPDSSGKFTAATEESLIQLCAYLCDKFKLTAGDIIRHYDVTGKQCPLYYVPTRFQSKEVADLRWNALKTKVAMLMSGGSADTVTSDSITASTLPYKVKIVCDELNVRKEAGTAAAVVCTLKSPYIYTVVEETKVGSVPWGKLKSGIGWISLGNKYVAKL